jgi:hypothetical protein
VNGPSDRALHCSRGEHCYTESYFLDADVLVTNIRPQGDILIPRSLLRVRCWFWRVFPTIQEVEGLGPFQVVLPPGCAIEKR